MQRQDVVLVIGIALALITWVMTGVPVTPVRPWLGAHLWQMTLFLLIGAPALFALRLAAQAGRRHRVRGPFLRALLIRHFGLRTVLIALRFVLPFAIVMTIHTSIKQAIPLIHADNWDQALIGVERAVHFGANPAWDLVQSDPPMWWTGLLDAAYYWWFPSIPLIGAYFLTHRRRVRREHYFAAFTAIWIPGILIGLAFPSHGPCYVDPQHFPAAGMYIARMVQGWLWERYCLLDTITVYGDGGLQFGCGLMAMPSMHITVAALYAMFLWREGGLWRWGSMVYAILVFLGSIYSGWHYAIDGYVGVAIAALCMWFTGKPLTPSPRLSCTGKTH